MSQSSMVTIEQISLSADGEHLLLMLTAENSVVTKEHIACLLQHPSLPRYKIDIDGITAAVTQLASLNQIHDTNNLDIDPIIIANKQDAELHVVIADDNMSAYAEITSASGGKSITLSEMKATCDELNICFGLLPKSMLALINTCNKCSAGKAYKVNIANGRPPENGQDATFVKLIKTDNHRIPKPQLLPNGKVDMHDLGKTITVSADTVLMKKHPATEGQPGKNILGEVIAQQAGIDFDFELNKNTMLDPSNPLQLISSHHGIPIDEGDFIRVDDIQVLNEINVKSGNVDYDGTVIITGDVLEGMQVKASGDITIMGVVESSNIICGGDLTIKMPILGHQKPDETSFTSVINCKGNLTGTLAQYTHLIVGKDLTMSNQLMHCNTECKGSIFVHNETMTKGSIIGGTTRANGEIITTIMGTNAGNKTNVDLVGDFNNLMKYKKKYIHELQQIDDLLQKVKKEDIKATSLLDKDKRKNIKTLLASKKNSLRAESDLLQSKLFDTKMKITHYYGSTHLTITKKLFSDITVSIGKQRWYSANSVGPSVISVVNEEMKLEKYKR